jgi:hypothetical protein
MQVLIGPAWSRNAGPAALACGTWQVLQVIVSMYRFNCLKLNNSPNKQASHNAEMLLKPLLLLLLQISYGATSVELKKDRYYNMLFSNVPSTASFNHARLAVLDYFGWKRVAILQEYDDKLYSSVSNIESVLHE